MSIGGNIKRRGKKSWRIKYEAGRDPVTQRRRTVYETVRGNKDDAKDLLAKRLVELKEGEFIERSTATLADYARHWLKTVAPAKVSAKTLERYSEIVEKHIIPQIGEIPLQKLDGTAIDTFYAHLRTTGRRDGKGGLSSQTVQHVHRLLSQILKSAVKGRKLKSSPMGAVQTTPKVRRAEIQV